MINDGLHPAGSDLNNIANPYEMIPQMNNYPHMNNNPPIINNQMN